jgi:hypothetical protein
MNYWEGFKLTKFLIMRPVYLIIIILYLLVCLNSCDAGNNAGEHNHPSIFLARETTRGFTSMEDFAALEKDERRAAYIKKLLAETEKDLMLPYIDPTTDIEGRSAEHLKHANVSYDMERLVSERLSRSSFLFLYTGEQKYKNLVMHQIEALYDTILWPMWCDRAHVNIEPHLDIRTCRISMGVALSYNWLYDYLTEEERRYIVDGLDKRAIQPFWQKLEQRPGWYLGRHNWFTNILGGMGITAMALGDDHPDTKALLDTIVPAMIAFNKEGFGEMGECNEAPGYAGAVRFLVEFAEAYRYYTKNTRNLLNEKPFPEICYWMMYHTLPPGRTIGFGDTKPEKLGINSRIFAAVAGANNDGILQRHYLNYTTEIGSVFEFLWYNSDIEPVSPDGKLPLGIEYKEYGASLISRTSWDPISTPCVVYGKAGRELGHYDNDVGQLLIDGFGERLIIDPGPPLPVYPGDYFNVTTMYNYYNRSSRGHNVLAIGGREMVAEPNLSLARGSTLKSWFNDTIGSYWEIDLTPVYGNATRVTRKVAHFFPGIVLVHDQAELPKAETVDLVWHGINPPQLKGSGNFEVRGDQVALAAKVISLDDVKLSFTTGHHEYKPPYNLTRQGDPLVQHYEPYIKISIEGKLCSILSLFAIVENNGDLPTWEETSEGWTIEVKGKDYVISVKNGMFDLTDGIREISF